ncbi:sulfur oxidation c-type cytochrome SoxX [Methylobacter luteus]|uniref:sulfur oxidation c-type cytochrome SoxX n=1 Tax=Methylobacter luteus TaxID=415 RepID=UPI0004251AFD|nr:sulfur oxidation c-type cytochrome SoxX [Methylobacter luteus]
MKFGFIAFILLLPGSGMADIPKQRLDEGRQIAFDRNKGNCLACHVIADGESPGNIGPALAAIPGRFKDKQQLHEQIWDATRFNPETSMPPFGRNRILDAEEIDKVVDYLWSLE